MAFFGFLKHNYGRLFFVQALSNLQLVQRSDCEGIHVGEQLRLPRCVRILTKQHVRVKLRAMINEIIPVVLSENHK